MYSFSPSNLGHSFLLNFTHINNGVLKGFALVILNFLSSLHTYSDYPIPNNTYVIPIPSKYAFQRSVLHFPNFSYQNIDTIFSLVWTTHPCFYRQWSCHLHRVLKSHMCYLNISSYIDIMSFPSFYYNHGTS